jgi:glutathione S-transferase
MLKLLTFRGGFDEPSLSPFCLKAMILLDLAGQPWQPEWTDMPPKESYGKLPALRTPDGLIADSGFIQNWLEKQGADLFPGLGPRQRAQAHAIIRMVEENLRLGLAHERWLRDDNWARLQKDVFGGMPAPLRLVIPGRIRKGIRIWLTKAGMARFSEADRLRNLSADLDALDMLLGDDPWFFGTRPTALDAAVLPMLSGLDTLPSDSGLRRAIRERERLMAYIHRGRAQLYPSLDDGLTSGAAAA